MLLEDLYIFEYIMLEGIEDKANYLAAKMVNKIAAAADKDHSAKFRSMGEEPKVEEIARIVSEIAKADPTPKGASLQWLVNHYVKGSFLMEDLKKIREALETFYRVRQKLPVKDLLQYKDLNDLYDAIEEFEKQKDEPVSKKQAKKKAKTEGVDVIINTPDFKGFEVKTYDAMCVYGAETKWCTTQDESTFNHYARKAPLFQIITTIDGKKRKFLLHTDTSQYMNERDLPITGKELKELQAKPEFVDFIEKVIERVYEVQAES